MAFVGRLESVTAALRTLRVKYSVAGYRLPPVRGSTVKVRPVTRSRYVWPHTPSWPTPPLSTEVFAEPEPSGSVEVT